MKSPVFNFEKKNSNTIASTQKQFYTNKYKNINLTIIHLVIFTTKINKVRFIFEH